jgi:hypothetical protein
VAGSAGSTFMCEGATTRMHVGLAMLLDVSVSPRPSCPLEFHPQQHLQRTWYDPDGRAGG